MRKTHPLSGKSLGAKRPTAARVRSTLEPLVRISITSGSLAHHLALQVLGTLQPTCGGYTPGGGHLGHMGTHQLDRDDAEERD
jgi:hypothetical protein